MIEKASPAQMRQTLDLVEEFKKMGLRFVPIPVLTDDEYTAKLYELKAKMDQINLAIGDDA